MKYSPSGTPKTIDAIGKRLMSSEQKIEIQDWFLSDDELSSHAGVERPIMASRTVEVLGELGFVRLPGGTLQTLGKVLVDVAKRAKILPLPDVLTGNPFKPVSEISGLVLYQLLLNDKPFVLSLLSEFVEGPASFYKGFGLHTNVILNNVENNTRRTMANRETFMWLDKQKQFAKRLTAPTGSRKVTIESAYRPIEDMLLPRCEFFVDLGILNKPDPYDNTFEMSTPGVEFFRRISEPKFSIEAEYFSMLSDLQDTPTSSVSNSQMIDFLMESYISLRNPARYAPIVETVLRSNFMATLRGDSSSLEISEAKEMLADMARVPNSPVRIVSDRHRKPGAFRYQEPTK